MKTTVLYLVVFFSALTSCNSQSIKNKQTKSEKNKPHEEVIVNRKYDENGNLIEFDSTYTAYYSNIKGDTIHMDSLLEDFPAFFNEEFFKLNSNGMINPFFGQDSVLNSKFFHDDFFEQQFMYQNEHMLKMMQEMDSIKNSYFERHSSSK
ncbi:MAG: hypothetical protein KQH79_04255 [Bacteroidetes bacterium]|nr:hypothetical protein [Bacteroidota bacterium]